MKKFFFFSLFGFLFLFFAMASEAIVSVKLQELRFGILRDQLMNYELSSQTLRERLKQMFLSKDDYMTEVKVNILESGIMNSETEGLDLKVSWKDKFGLYVINSVRFLNLKSPLELEEQQKTIIRLQFAFYMERTRKYPIASKKYQELEESITSTLSDEMAFALLHHGYCLVMMGDRDKAFVKLNKAIDLFPGSHYAENAALLISFLEDGQKKKEELKSKKKSPEELAYSLFQSGDYEETLRTLESLPSLTNDQSYIKARSMEELGKTSNAVKEYIQLVKQKENKEVAIRANRRLLLIGNFYQENKSLVAFSKEEATKLGDTKAAENIEEGKSLVLKPVIIEKILKTENSSNLSKEETTELNQIKDEIKLSLEDSKQETKRLALVVSEEKLPLVPETSPTTEKKAEDPPKNLSQNKDANVPLKLKVKLRDGREVVCDEVLIEGNLASLKLGSFGLNLPYDLIVSVQSSQPKKGKIKIGTNNGIAGESSKWIQNQSGDWVLSKDAENPVTKADVRYFRL
ncbi:tetratricopeptide repeat protein [Leptospira limi]|uniref:Tetratricopeptide repeat protein n=1 Tax=Leptospira limi TaxID=2950023 RepID=A0ABT3LY66_9LEPT|nr:tetratricopeptide repeat protein [Leptospira limi]MCW7462651.1 tetratricopeptide repeat protein [Leptospira limi]